MSREITRSEIRMFLVEDGIYANKKGFEPLVRVIDIYRRGQPIMKIYHAVQEEFKVSSERLLIKNLQGAICTSKARRKMEKKSVGAYVAMARTVLESTDKQI